MKFAVIIVGCMLLSTPALAGETGCGQETVEYDGRGVIVESTIPETTAARRAGPLTSTYSSKPAVVLPLSWHSFFYELLQLLLR